MKRFISCLFATFFIFNLGISVIALPFLIANWVLGWEATTEKIPGYAILIATGAGIFSVALAIWDGQFIDTRKYVKKSHWVHRKDGTK